MKTPKLTKEQEKARAEAAEAGYARSAAFQKATQRKGMPMTYGTGKPPGKKEQPAPAQEHRP